MQVKARRQLSAGLFLRIRGICLKEIVACVIFKYMCILGIGNEREKV